MNKTIRKIENLLQTENGQRFLQYGYSFGAAIVIFGAMVKVLHWWGVWGNVIFGTGMAIECLVFVLYGLDRPAGLNQPVGGISGIQIGGSMPVGSGAPQSGDVPSPVFSENAPVSGGGTTHVVFHGTPQPSPSPSYSPTYQQPPIHAKGQTAPPIVENMDSRPDAPILTDDDHVGQLSSVSDNVQRFADATETLTRISESLQESYKHIIDNSQNISQNSLGYVQQMESLNRNISGLNTIYEIQLKSISGQLDNIEQINTGLNRIKSMYNDAIPDSSVIKQETEKMAEQIRELNQIYARMIQAMTNSQTGTTNL